MGFYYILRKFLLCKIPCLRHISKYLHLIKIFFTKKFIVVLFSVFSFVRCQHNDQPSPVSQAVNDVNATLGAVTMCSQVIPPVGVGFIINIVYGTVSGAAASGLMRPIGESVSWPGAYNDTINLRRLEQIAGDPNNQYDYAGRIHNKILNDFFKYQSGRNRPMRVENTEDARNFIFDYIMNDTINSCFGFNEENRAQVLPVLNEYLSEGIIYQNDNISTSEQFNNRFNFLLNRSFQRTTSSCRQPTEGLNLIRSFMDRTFSSDYSLNDLLSETSNEVRKINRGDYGLDELNKSTVLAGISVLRHSAVYWNGVR